MERKQIAKEILLAVINYALYHFKVFRMDATRGAYINKARQGDVFVFAFVSCRMHPQI